MIKAVLLDLDNTLLVNTDDQFVPAYIRRLDAFFQQYWHQSVSAIIRGVSKYSPGIPELENTYHDRLLAAVAEAMSQPHSVVAETMAAFYTDAYPDLRDCTTPIEIAAEVLQYLLISDCAVVIATNPLYPDEAIRQRLKWAGLPAEFDQYALVTTAENMHFTKAEPAYYAEIVARVGIEPDEALMVGDRLDTDIEHARSIGLNTFHITASGHANGSQSSGTLAQFYDHLLHDDWREAYPPQPLRPAMIEPELLGNVAAMFSMLKNIPPRYWEQHPIPNEWSILQIICHLLESEHAVQLPRLQRILAEDNPFLRSPQPPPGPTEAQACDQSGLRAARRWAEKRHETILWLRQLSAEDWRRPARHSIFGLTTLLEMAHFTAQHDRLHLNQLCQTLGRCE